MRDTFPFLIRLGLQGDADAKDIRRAYARELKKIDQSADPAGFQELREAYEVALQWQAHRQFAGEPPEADTATSDAELPPAPVHEPAEEIPLRQQAVSTEAVPTEAVAARRAPDDPYQLAAAAFEKFTASTDMLVKRNDARHQSIWKTVLQRSLDSDDLLNLSARSIFEAHIAHLLASGWKPGHETLFVVASDVFEWTRDSRRLAQFGEAGAMLNRAIDEWKLYETLSPHAIGTFKQLIQQVRATPNAAGVAGRSDLLLFQQLAGRFYTWLAVIIDRDTLDSWSGAAHAEAQRPGAAPAQQLTTGNLQDAQPEKSSPWSFQGSNLIWIFIVFAALRGCFSMLNEKPKGFYPPATSLSQPALQQPAPERPRRQKVEPEKPLSQERIDEIRSRISYQWPADLVVGEYIAVYDVFIDADGGILGMNKVSSSGVNGYDAAVAKAIRESKPFPPGTKTRFTLRYGVTVGKPAASKGKPPTQEQLRAVQDEIFYVPGSVIKSGELRVSYEVELNAQGKVIKLKKLKGSRDPMYDEVVADALKATQAFPPGTQRKFSVEYYRNLGEH